MEHLLLCSQNILFVLAVVLRSCAFVFIFISVHLILFIFVFVCYLFVWFCYWLCFWIFVAQINNQVLRKIKIAVKSDVKNWAYISLR